MKETAPIHIKKFCYEDNKDRTYCELRERIYDEVHFLWKIKCDCGETKLKVFTDKHPSVFCKCSQCNKDITVYDLSNYPAAVKLNEEFEENDEHFDQNDITWATVYIGNGNIVEKILDDETA